MNAALKLKDLHPSSPWTNIISYVLTTNGYKIMIEAEEAAVHIATALLLHWQLPAAD